MVKRKVVDYGFDTVYLQEVMVPHWERGSVEECYYFDGEEKVSLRIMGAGGTVSTPEEGITAEVVEVLSLEELDVLGKEGVEGKIVFYNKAFNQRYINIGASYGETGFQRRLGAIKAAEYGAVASVLGHYPLEMMISHIQAVCHIKKVLIVLPTGIGCFIFNKIIKKN